MPGRMLDDAMDLTPALVMNSRDFDAREKRAKKWLWCAIPAVLALAIAAGGLSIMMVAKMPNGAFGIGEMVCPAIPPEMNQFSDDDYSKPAKEKLAHIDEFIAHYRETEFDAWGRTYVEVMEGMRNWKTKHFTTRNIKSGEKMYESACGIGLNSVMTLEIMKEHGITDIEASGNDYVGSSIDLAQVVLDRLAPDFGGRKGTVCWGDSTDLSNIPNSTFDLVYTGYIAPIEDPLDMNLDWHTTMSRIKELCTSAAGGDWKSKLLLDVAEKKQNEWHNKWVSEMIRIAKPGKAIILEQVRYPKVECRQGNFTSNIFGQDKGWWKGAIEEYGWDVDPNSLDYEDDTIFGNRYHLFMRKN